MTLQEQIDALPPLPEQIGCGAAPFIARLALAYLWVNCPARRVGGAP